MAKYEKGKLYILPIIDFKEDPDQPRKYFEPQALAELAESINKHGILQPVLFREGEQGYLIIVSGERRLRAARMANILAIPGIFTEGDPAEIALVENIQRQDLNAIEEAEAMDRVIKQHGYSQDNLAGIMGKSPTAISETLSLNKLPQEIRDECRKDPTVPKNILIAIARNKQERSMLTQYRKFREQQQLAGVKKTRTGGKRTKAETFVNTIAATEQKISSLEIQSLSADDQVMVNQAMSSLRDTLDGVLAR
jgi:ParB family chromosome partitioning protein